ncbi:hypothetical protein NMY22_g10071 [Coprinellus aureogranulatus]|nr:hypothetical protein NMY22_g10071 [Coprinellus aureogranulatus]
MAIRISASGRTCRIPSRFREAEFVETSHMPALTRGEQKVDVEVATSPTTLSKMDSKAGLGDHSTTTGALRSTGSQPQAVYPGVDHDMAGITIKTEPREDEEALMVATEENSSQRQASQTHAMDVDRVDRVVDEEQERFRLEHAIQTIDALNMRIQKLERTEQRLKRQLRQEKERHKSSKAEGEGALNLLVLAEEKLSDVEAVMAVLKRDVDRYRGWWLTEYYSLRAVLTMLSREQREDVHALAQSAEARFMTFQTAHD